MALVYILQGMKEIRARGAVKVNAPLYTKVGIFYIRSFKTP
jgi:hypothetical protein